MIPSDPFSLSTTLPGLPNEQNTNPNPNPPPPLTKKKRNLPGTPGNIKPLILIKQIGLIYF